MSATITRTLDLKGLSCPLPIAKTAQAIRDLSVGELIEVYATDPGSVPDFIAWCTTTGRATHGRQYTGRYAGHHHEPYTT